jgi:hypothetical protein
MFDLKKDMDKYRGIPPYASEHYGVYQPLLGWQSHLTKKWLSKGGQLFDPAIKRILDGRIVPGPSDVAMNHPLEFIAQPLQPGSGKSPFKVLVTKDLNSDLMGLIAAKVQTFVDAHAGKLPEGAEWAGVIDINNLMDVNAGDLRKTNDIHRQRLFDQATQDAAGQPLSDAAKAMAKQTQLRLMQYESQIAAFLLELAEGQAGADPNELKKLFTVQVAPSLEDILRPSDPLANIDPRDGAGALSPVGMVHLFRQYFFDLGSFLGEPVEHVWLAPGTTLELVEISTRKTLVERMLETATESTTREESSDTQKEELADAVKSENGSNVKLGVSTTNTVNYGVYQGTVSATFGVETTRKEAREQSHKQSREQSEKLSSEIKKSFKSVFRTVTETSDMRSRRYVLQNLTEKLVNYELRRKMRRVGVQMQDIGSRLCWQVFVDDPGATVGLSELVHFAESPDFSSLKDPQDPPAPVNVTKKVVAPIPFAPILDYSDNSSNYEFAYLETIETQYKGKYLSIIKGNEDDSNSQTIFGPFTFTFDPPAPGFQLTDDVRVLGPQGNKIAIVRSVIVDKATNAFTLIMQRVNYGGENVINLDVELVYAPGAAALADYDAKKKLAQAKYDAEKEALARRAFATDVRARIKDANSIRARPTWDLREEERTIVYRKLIERLMLDSWKLPDTEANRRLSHVRSELVRAIFDVDGMLYFVAPEWWMPRRRRGQLNLNQSVAGKPYALTHGDVLSWSGEQRADNYRITEDSAPARLGSSLGWLMQLDGDNLRNAFLNAPWVKAVIPIRPGRENAALNWLRSIEGHDNDGWTTPYLGAGPEDAEFAGKTVGEVLTIIADRMSATADIKTVLASDSVFENGFDPLAGGFDAGLPANQVFSQWISVLPTDQIVAAEYTPTLTLDA